MQDPVRVGPFAEGDHVWVVIETPAGSRTRYEWDEDARAYRAGRVLPPGIADAPLLVRARKALQLVKEAKR